MKARVANAIVAAMLAVTGVACSDDGNPVEVVRGGGIDFAIDAQTRLISKSVVEVTARLTRIDPEAFPLRFTFEKGNVGQPFVLASERVVTDPNETAVSIRLAARADPRVRVTVAEVRPDGFSLTKSIQIDVLSFTE